LLLFKRATLDKIVSGEVDLAFRRWARPRVKVGTRLRTAVGVLEVTAVDVVPYAKLTEKEARRAGFASRTELLEALEGREGTIHRVRLRYAGEDPRIALRQRSRLTDEEIVELQRRLGRLDAASRHGAWTSSVLRLIAEKPGVSAGDLAEQLGRERLAFKRDVRKLKELGLTESMKVGYCLSRRGRTFLMASLNE
jgi:DNA-binding transcriptional ArsR family regulator